MGPISRRELPSDPLPQENNSELKPIVATVVAVSAMTLLGVGVALTISGIGLIPGVVCIVTGGCFLIALSIFGMVSAFSDSSEKQVDETDLHSVKMENEEKRGDFSDQTVNSLSEKSFNNGGETRQENNHHETETKKSLSSNDIKISGLKSENKISLADERFLYQFSANEESFRIFFPDNGVRSCSTGKENIDKLKRILNQFYPEVVEEYKEIFGDYEFECAIKFKSIPEKEPWCSNKPPIEGEITKNCPSLSMIYNPNKNLDFQEHTTEEITQHKYRKPGWGMTEEGVQTKQIFIYKDRVVELQKKIKALTLTNPNGNCYRIPALYNKLFKEVTTRGCRQDSMKTVREIRTILEKIRYAKIPEENKNGCAEATNNYLRECGIQAPRSGSIDGSGDKIVLSAMCHEGNHYYNVVYDTEKQTYLKLDSACSEPEILSRWPSVVEPTTVVKRTEFEELKRNAKKTNFSKWVVPANEKNNCYFVTALVSCIVQQYLEEGFIAQQSR